MGRKPNPVLAEYFLRGARNLDSSNRYAHTCRRCGEWASSYTRQRIVADHEQFDKGRAEHLTHHLLKECSHLTEDERANVFERLEQRALGEKTDGSKQKTPRKSRNALSAQLSASQARQQSALETLAEVSRHHLDYSIHRQLPPNDLSDVELAEQALWTQLQEHNLTMSDQPGSNDYNLGTDLHHVPFTAESTMPAMVAAVTATQQGFASSGLAYASNFTQLDPQLDADTAARIAAQIEYDQHHERGASQSGNAQAGDGIRDPIDVDSIPSTAKAQVIHPRAKPRRVQSEVAQAGHEITDPIDIDSISDTANAQAAQERTTSRSKFTEDRRKEVQETRKRGACIRCRMLKKPCSDGTPCQTCANLGPARLWKGRCLRTKLSDEFGAWKQQFFNKLWEQRYKVDTDDEAVAPAIELEVAISPAATLRLPVTAQHDRTGPHDDSTPPTIALAISDQTRTQLADYCKTTTMFQSMIDAEMNPLIRASLATARDMSEERALLSANSAPVSSATPRNGSKSSYNIPSQLLEDAEELYTITRLLTLWRSPDSLLSFHLRSKFPAAMSDDMLAALTIANHERLELQLFVLLEDRAAKISKKVMTSLERHLLQRQQVSNFATYLAAIILLACVERMTTFYQSFDMDAQLQAHWSLPSTPSAIWSQGTSFAEFLVVLLCMRGLPPRVYEDEHGLLAMLDERSGSFTKLNGVVSEAHVRAQDEERRQALTDWLYRCSVNADDARSWLVADHGWHGKFVAAALLINDPMVDAVFH